MEIKGINSVSTSIPEFSKNAPVDPVDRPSVQPEDKLPLAREEVKPDELEQKKENLAEAVDKLNKTALIFDRSLKFQIHDKTRTTMVSVIDLNTEKVIREIPPKEILDLVSKMRDYLGMIFDKKA